MLDYHQIVYRCIWFTKVIIYKNPSYVNQISSVHVALDLTGAHIEAEFGGSQNKPSSSFQQNSGYKEAGKSYLNCLSPVTG